MISLKKFQGTVISGGFNPDASSSHIEIACGSETERFSGTPGHYVVGQQVSVERLGYGKVRIVKIA